MTFTGNILIDDGAVAPGFFVWNPETTEGASITDYRISISSGNNPIFPAFTFTPANSYANGNNPVSCAYGWLTDATFAHYDEGLDFEFTPAVPFYDGIATTILNTNLSTNSIYNVECWHCDPYVGFAATNPPGNGSPGNGPSAVPEPGSLSLAFGGVAAISLALRRRMAKSIT